MAKHHASMRPRTKNIIRWCLTVVFACVFFFSAGKLLSIYAQYRQGETTYSDLASLVLQTPRPQSSSAPIQLPESSHSDQQSSQSAQASATPEPTPIIPDWPPVVDFDTLTGINSQVIGWISLPGTVISYPVAKGTDNSYYLSHLFNGTANSSGTIFVDAYNADGFADFNTMIYGHNMNNGSMFACLNGYKNQSYYDAHPIIYLMMPDGNYEIRLFSAHITHSVSSDYTMNFATDEEKADFLAQLTAQSNFVSQYTPTVQDHIVTFSTCTYEYDDARYVVHGILVKTD